MQRMGLPGTQEERKRAEFFNGSLAQAKRALKAIGRGDFFEFDSNDITKMRKQTLTRGDEIETTQVKLRESPRLVANRETVELLAQNDPPTVQAIDKVSQAVRKSPRLSTSGNSTPLTVTLREDDLERLRNGDEMVARAITRLRDIQQVRRSGRLRGRTVNYRE